jgi:aspartate/methionine/tyrosine aminotransferase
MRIAPFELERWQSIWEHKVELNISESGVLPLTAADLLADPAVRERVLAAPLGYPQTNGSEELRANIATQYPGATHANVLVTCGCSEANYIVTWALLEPGDEVIFMQPNYMQVAGVAEAFGVVVKPLWLREELNWAPDLAELRRQVTPKTKLIALCNPNNPTGALLSEQAINEICTIAGRAGAWLLADEVYRGAELSGVTSPTFHGRYERVLCTGGLSKAYGLPGLRTGWVVGPAELIEKLWGYHDYTSIGPTLLTDRLAALALEPSRREQIFARTRNILRQNYPVVRDWVAQRADVLRHVPPAAGAIAWVGISGGGSTRELAELARQRAGILLVPGEHFAMPGYIRVGFGYGEEKLQQALAKLNAFLPAAARA